MTKGLVPSWVGPVIVALRAAIAAEPDINQLKDQLTAALKSASDAQAADAKDSAALAQSEADRKAESLHYQTQIAALNQTVADQTARLSSLNNELTTKDGQIAGDEKQLAVEKLQVADLQRQLTELKKAPPQPPRDDLKEEMQKLADSLIPFPDLKRVIDGFISRL